MDIIRWEPFSGINPFRNRMNHMFDHFFFPVKKDDESVWSWNPVADIYEDDGNLVIRAELPGVDKDKISVLKVNVINPCTNEPVTVTWTDLMLVTRNGQDANGGIHTIWTLEGSIVDTSGNTGQFLWTSHANGADPDTYKETEHFTVIGRNSDTKQTIVLHSTARFSYEDGVPSVDFFIFDAA